MFKDPITEYGGDRSISITQKWEGLREVLGISVKHLAFPIIEG